MIGYILGDGNKLMVTILVGIEGKGFFSFFSAPSVFLLFHFFLLFLSFAVLFSFYEIMKEKKYCRQKGEVIQAYKRLSSWVLSTQNTTYSDI